MNIFYFISQVVKYKWMYVVNNIMKLLKYLMAINFTSQLINNARKLLKCLIND